MLMVTGVSRVFRNHDRLFACSDSRSVWCVLKRLVPTNWGKGTVNGGSVNLDLRKRTRRSHVPTGSSYRRKNQV